MAAGPKVRLDSVASADENKADSESYLEPSTLQQKLLKRETLREEIRKELFTSDRAKTENAMEQLQSVSNKKFVLIQFGKYYYNKTRILPAEMHVGAFSIRRGIEEQKSCLIDPVADVPRGFYSEIMYEIKQCGYFEPGFTEKNKNTYMRDLQATVDFILSLFGKEDATLGSPVLYTAQENAQLVTACFKWLKESAGINFDYKLRSLNILVEVLLTEADHLRSILRIQRFPLLGKRDEIGHIWRGAQNRLGAESACAHHQQPEFCGRSQFCSSVIVKAWIYSILKYVSRHYNCARVEGCHFPPLETQEEVVVMLTDKLKATIFDLDGRGASHILNSAQTSDLLKEARTISVQSSRPMTSFASEVDDTPIELQPDDDGTNSSVAAIAAGPSLPFGKGYGRGRGRLIMPRVPEKLGNTIGIQKYAQSGATNLPLMLSFGESTDTEAWHTTDDEVFDSISAPGVVKPRMPKIREKDQVVEPTSPSLLSTPTGSSPAASISGCRSKGDSP